MSLQTCRGTTRATTSLLSTPATASSPASTGSGRTATAQYKGFIHYRRLLGSADKAKQRSKDPYEKLVDGPELLALLRSRDVVLARQRNYYIETVYDHYSHTMDGLQLDILMKGC
jgi:hypothetical protein